MLVWNGAVAALFVLTAHNAWTAAVTVMLVGCGFAIVPGLQTRLMDVAADAQTLAAALNHSAFNVANALGAWLGGVTIAAGYGWTSTGLVAALLSVAGLAVFAISLAIEKRFPSASPAIATTRRVVRSSRPRSLERRLLRVFSSRARSSRAGCSNRRRYPVGPG